MNFFSTQNALFVRAKKQALAQDNFEEAAAWALVEVHWDASFKGVSYAAGMAAFTLRLQGLLKEGALTTEEAGVLQEALKQATEAFKAMQRGQRPLPRKPS